MPVESNQFMSPFWAFFMPYRYHGTLLLRLEVILSRVKRLFVAGPKNWLLTLREALLCAVSVTQTLWLASVEPRDEASVLKRG